MGFDGIKLGDEAYEWDEIEQMSTRDLESLFNDAESAVTEIGSQINEAKAHARRGDFADPAWFQRAKSAKSRMSGAVQRLGRVLKARRRQTSRDFCDYFMEAARAILSKETYDNIMSMARRKAKDDRQLD